MDEQELNKKLAEWARFKYAGKHNEREWEYPDGELKIELPNFTQSLDACFKWLVPKFNSTYNYCAHWITVAFHSGEQEDSENNSCEIRVRGIRMALEFDVNPALALCLAIEKLIDSEQSSQLTVPLVAV